MYGISLLLSGQLGVAGLTRRGSRITNANQMCEVYKRVEQLRGMLYCVYVREDFVAAARRVEITRRIKLDFEPEIGSE